MSTALEESVNAVHRLFTEVFQEGNVGVADEILTEDFRFQYPFPGFAPGPEGIKEFTKLFHRAFPGFELEVNDLFGSSGHQDARVAIRWTLRGEHKGDLLGIGESGKYVTLSAIGIYHGGWGRPGLLSSGWLELDTLGMLQQLHVVPSIHEILPNLRGKD